MSIFEKASRLKLRFEVTGTKGAGLLSVEELWDLDMTSETGKANLRTLCLELHAKLQQGSALPAFLNEAAPKDPEAQLRMDLARHVWDTRTREANDKANAKAAASRADRIAEVLAKREDEELGKLPPEELKRQLAEARSAAAKS